jgi:ribosome biogenesis GTPase / thiamine phosphate phosphatase
LDLDDLGWTEAMSSAFDPFVRTCRPGRVSAVFGHKYLILAAGDERSAVVSGRVREAAAPVDLPTVGDWVAFEPLGSDQAVIRAVLPRVTCLMRKAAGRTSDAQALAANVDHVLIVMGLDGDFNLRRLERALVLVHQSGAAPVVVLNKSDVDASAVPTRCEEARRVAGSASIHAVSARQGDGIGDLAPYLARGRTAALLGSSGAGKSTLLNRLMDDDRQPTRPVREHDSRGRHTTTRRQMFVLPSGALFIDTPGIREIPLVADDQDLGDVFDEIAALATQCRFRDCRHEGEPGCAVSRAVADGSLARERLDSLRKLEAERDYQATREDGALARQRKTRWKALHKAARQRMKDKGRG